MRAQRGQGLVEFALISTVFLLFFFVILDGGRAIYAWATVAESVREGAHAAEMTESTDAQVRSAINSHTGLLGDLGAQFAGETDVPGCSCFGLLAAAEIPLNTILGSG